MDNLTQEQRKKNMQNIRSMNTAPERKVMSELRKRKIYFAKHVKTIIGKPDIVFRRKNLLVFIDSDFWHYNSKKFIMPKTNIIYWRKKIAYNTNHDKKVNTALKLHGWTVLRFWESDVNNKLQYCIKRITRVLAQYDGCKQ